MIPELTTAQEITAYEKAEADDKKAIEALIAPINVDDPSSSLLFGSKAQE